MKPINEIWTPIEGFPRYKISNHGNILCASFSITTSAGGTRKYPQRVIQPRLNKNSGLLQLGLKNFEGKTITLYVHKLVAQHFLPNKTPKKRKWVCHIDGNLLNNNVENLIWVSKAEAIQNRYKHSTPLERKKQGRKDPLNETKIQEAIKIRKETGKSWQKIALDIGCSASHLWKKAHALEE